MKSYPATRRHDAAAAALQWYLGLDPDTSKYAAERVLFHADRAGIRESTSGLPTAKEVTRAVEALGRRQITVKPDDAYAALYAALALGVYEEATA